MYRKTVGTSEVSVMVYCRYLLLRGVVPLYSITGNIGDVF